ncbi:aspartyl protease family protein [Myroides sp. N17-2]|uniref:aspartyl protease family protein n=1 Tax=Myroides sp. N17-2 TaxID=2030799 RepID=UPI000EFB013D|nr:aspartyl protease family protein [Myroides sp. N17-2]
MKYLFTLLVSSFCSIHTFAQTESISDTIPFVLNKYNTMYIKAVFNQTDTLNLNFDTGSSALTLTNDVLNNKLQSKVSLYHTLYELKIGNQVYKTEAYDAQLSGHDTDGRFGWDLFKNQIVEMNYEDNIMVIHSHLPDSIAKDNAYTKLAINYFDNVFSVQSTIVQDKIENTDLFLFDTGYNRTVMLDNDLMKSHNFPFEQMKVIKTIIMKGAKGNEIPVITANLQLLKIGDYTLKDVPAQQLTTHKPLRGKNIHILGNEVLKRFNAFLDFKENIVYLKPSKLYDIAYTDK